MPTDFYQLVEDAFLSATGISRLQARNSWPVEAEEALTELQPFVTGLRDAYAEARRRGSIVDIDYSGSWAWAYLLAYVPKYIHQSMTVLGRAGLDAADHEKKRVGLFCCGPCPEAVALLEMLRGPGEEKQPDRFCLDLFDSGHDGWKATRDALLDMAFLGRICDLGSRETGWESTLSDPPGIYDFDIMEGLGAAHRQVVPQLDVAMIQNVCSELGPGPDAADQTIEEIAQLLPPGSKLILSDTRSALTRHKRLLCPLGRYGQVGVRNTGNEYDHVALESGGSAWRNYESIQAPAPTTDRLARRFLSDGPNDYLPARHVFLNYLVLERASASSF